MYGITRAGIRSATSMIRSMSDASAGGTLPGLWKKLGQEVYNRAPTIVITCGVTAIVSGTAYVVNTVDGHIRRLDGRIDKLDGRIDKLDGRIDKLGDRLETRIEAVRKEAREDTKELRDKIEALTKLVVEALAKR